MIPGLRLAEVAVVLAGSLAGKRIPGRIPPREVIPVLARGVAECGGLDGVRRLTERNRLMSAQERTAALTVEQRRERHAIWSGGRDRERALVDLAFRIMNNPHDGYRPEAPAPDPAGSAG